MCQVTTAICRQHMTVVCTGASTATLIFVIASTSVLLLRSEG